MVIALIAVVPSAAVVLWTGGRDRSRARDQTVQDYRQMVRAMATQQTDRVADAQRLLLTLALFPALSAVSPAACEALLPNVLRDHPDYVNLVVVNVTGSHFCVGRRVNLEHLSLATAITRPWFQRALHSRTTEVGDYQTGATPGQSDLVVAQPLVDSAGEPIRLVVALLSLEPWHAAASRLQLPPGAALTMFDRHRTILARLPNGPRWVGTHLPVAAPDRRQAADRSGLANVVSVDGVRRLFATEPVAAGFDTGLTIAMGADATTAFAAADRLLYQQLGFFGLIAILTIGAALVGGELFVLRPVSTLQEVTRRLANGDFTARAALAGGLPGLSDLGQAVNVMAVALESRSRERDRAEQAVHEANERTQLALRASGAGTWDVDLTTGHLRFSEMLEALHGLSAGTFGGTFEAFVACIEPEDRQAVQAEIVRARRAGTDAHIVYRTRWPDGSLHWLTGIGRTFYSSAGEPRRSAGVSFDVTERQMLEEHVRRAQKMEAVGRLAAGVSHNFNNLLTVTGGLAELLLARHEAPGEDRADLEEILKAAKRGTALVRQLLPLSRARRSSPKRVDLNQTLISLRDMVRPFVRQDIRVVVDVPATPMPVLIDRSDVDQVALNLVLNARDALPGGGEIRVDLRCLSAAAVAFPPDSPALAAEYVCLRVRDTGVGMTPEVQAHLFEPFFTTKGVGQGTGLGLAFVHGIMDQSRGFVTVDSALGSGTTFALYFPLVGESEDTSATKPAPR